MRKLNIHIIALSDSHYDDGPIDNVLILPPLRGWLPEPTIPLSGSLRGIIHHILYKELQ